MPAFGAAAARARRRAHRCRRRRRRSGGGGGPSGGGPSGAGGGDARLTRAFWRSRAPKRPTGNGKLADRFGTVPFDVIDAKKGPHQARKKQWHAIIDDGGRGGSTLGRKDNLIGAGYAALGGGRAGQANAGTSEYDPVVGEFAHRFYCPKPSRQCPRRGGRPVVVVDPFAGGSVRGILAAKLSCLYIGIDISPEQVAANKAQLHVCDDCVYKPRWVVGDGEDVVALVRKELAAAGLPPDTPADFVHTCPPYFDLEKYTDLPDDLSNLPSYDAFLVKYRKVLKAALSLLRPQHVAFVVVGNVRDQKTGEQLSLHTDTVTALKDAGGKIYQDGTLETMAGSAPLRAGRIAAAASKLTPTSQRGLSSRARTSA